jgi:hypothetical protein
VQFTRIGEFLAASRITGPTHNLLMLKLGRPPQGRPVCEAVLSQGGCVHEPLDEAALIASVLEGVAEANVRFGSKHSVTHIKYVANDTKPEAIYGFLALEIIKRLETGGDFQQGTNPNAL